MSGGRARTRRATAALPVIVDAFDWEAAVLDDVRERNQRLYELNASIVAGGADYKPF